MSAPRSVSNDLNDRRSITDFLALRRNTVLLLVALVLVLAGFHRLCVSPPVCYRWDCLEPTHAPSGAVADSGD